MKPYFLLLLFVSLWSAAQNSMTGTLKYNVAQNILSANLEIEVEQQAFSNDTLILRLNAKALITNVEGECIHSFDFSQFNSIVNARSNQLILVQTGSCDAVKFTLQYQIPEYSSYLHKDHWLEIHNEYSTYPINNQMKFTRDFELEMPAHFKLVSNGELKQLSTTAYQLHVEEANPVVFAGDQVQVLKNEEGVYPDLEVYSYFDEYGMMDSLYHYLGKGLDFYHSTFAKNDPKSDFKLVIIPFFHNFSFSHGNLISTRTFQQGDRVVKRIHSYMSTPYHETAHLWWHKANSETYDNWLNESFAEYTAALALKSVFGEEAFEKEVKYWRSKADNYGAVVDFQPTQTMVLYTKGALILYELHQKLGDNRFYEFLSLMQNKGITTIDDCLEMVNGVYGIEIRDWLYEKLRE